MILSLHVLISKFCTDVSPRACQQHSQSQSGSAYIYFQTENRRSQQKFSPKVNTAAVCRISSSYRPFQLEFCNILLSMLWQMSGGYRHTGHNRLLPYPQPLATKIIRSVFSRRPLIQIVLRKQTPQLNTL